VDVTLKNVRKIIKNQENSKIAIVMMLIIMLAVGAVYVYINTPQIESTQMAHTQGQS
jgi:hypothetical protein